MQAGNSCAFPFLRLQVKDLLQKRVRVFVRPDAEAPAVGGQGEWKAGIVTGYNHGCASAARDCVAVTVPAPRCLPPCMPVCL